MSTGLSVDVNPPKKEEPTVWIDIFGPELFGPDDGGEEAGGGDGNGGDGSGGDGEGSSPSDGPHGYDEYDEPPEPDDGSEGLEDWPEEPDSGPRGESPRPPLPRPPLPCPDERISERLGVPSGENRDELHGFDDAFEGELGERFRENVIRAARENHISPALLAMILLAEHGRSVYLSRGAVENAAVGLDHWDSQARIIELETGRIFRTTIVRDASNPYCTIPPGETECHFINERGVDTGRLHAFGSGANAASAVGAWTAVLIDRLVDRVNLFGWVGLSEEAQWALIRLSYNPGMNDPLALAQMMVDDVNEGRDPLARLPHEGPGGPEHPLRAATIRAAQALHLANTIFDLNIPCP